LVTYRIYHFKNRRETSDWLQIAPIITISQAINKEFLPGIPHHLEEKSERMLRWGGVVGSPCGVGQYRQFRRDYEL
jgi:hypothetical protein